MKYIVFDNGMFDDIVVFTTAHEHNKMQVELSIRTDQIISAGFVGLAADGPYCFGESISLKVKSRKEDTDLLRRFLTR